MIKYTLFTRRQRQVVTKKPTRNFVITFLMGLGEVLSTRSNGIDPRKTSHFFVLIWDRIYVYNRRFYLWVSCHGFLICLFFDEVKVQKDIQMNSGVFLCTKEGWYQFSAGVGALDGWIGVYLTVNGNHKTYARYSRLKINFVFRLWRYTWCLKMLCVSSMNQ